MNKKKILLFILMFVFMFFGLLNINKLKAFSNNYVFKYLPIPDDYVTDEIIWSIGDIKNEDEYVYIYSSNDINFTTIELRFKETYNKYELHYIDRNQLIDKVVFYGNVDNHLFYDNQYNTNVYSVCGIWYDLSYSVININDLSVFETYSSENLGYFYNNNVSVFLGLGNLTKTNNDANYISDFLFESFDNNILGNYYQGEFFYNQEYFKYIYFSRGINNELRLNLLNNSENLISFELNEIELNDLKENLFVNRFYITNSSRELDTFIIFENHLENVYNWNDFFLSIVNVPLIYFNSLLNFNILGFNLWLVLTGFVTLALVIWLLKRLL